MDKLASAVDFAMKSPEVVNKLRPMGIEPVGGTRQSFNEFVNAERARLGTIVKSSGMKEN